jgi:hypothetical protein
MFDWVGMTSPEPHLFMRRCLTALTAMCGYGWTGLG